MGMFLSPFVVGPAFKHQMDFTPHSNSLPQGERGSDGTPELLERVKYRLLDCLDALQDVVIPESNYSIAVLFYTQCLK